MAILSSSSLSGPKTRILFLDIARGFAIGLSLLMHTFYSLNPWQEVDVPVKRFLTILTQTATPLFVLLFGIMLELVYYRKIRDGESFSNISRRILRRSLWCYLGYILTILIELILKRRSVSEGMLSFLFLGDTPYSSILKFWTVALILSLPLLRLREKKGLTALFVLSLSLWLFVPLLGQITWPDPLNPFSYWTGMFFGKPSHRSLISLLHSMVFIVIGMILGEKLSSQGGEKHWTAFQKALGVFICADLLIVVCLMFFYSPHQLLTGYTTVFRRNHHLGYYGLAFLQGFAALFALSRLFTPSNTKAGKVFTPLITLGQHSLPAFVFGNILLTLCPKPAHPSVFLGFVYFAVIIAILTVLLKMKERFSSSKRNVQAVS